VNASDSDPFRLDVAAFAKVAGQLEGRWPLQDLDRLAESRLADAETAGTDAVAWSARGESRAMRGGETQIWLHVEAETKVTLECQRCLRPVAAALKVNRSFLFVSGEDAAAQLDTDSEDDVLALTRALDLRELIEDELLLALPIVPRHEVCPTPLRAPFGDDVADDKPNPFAVLAALKNADRPN
jgi:uncharacterized protein